MKIPRALAPGAYAPLKGKAEERLKDAIKQGVPQMRWVGATIQYKASRKLLDAAKRIGKHRNTSFSTMRQESSETYYKVWGSVMGNVTQDVVNVGFQQVADTFSPKPLSFDFDIEELRTQLENAIDVASGVVIGDLVGLARQLRETSDIDFGEWWLEAAGGDEEAAKKAIRGALDKQRRIWAKEWLYYGNDPNLRPQQELEHNLERQIWALWIIDVVSDVPYIDHYNTYFDTTSSGKDNVISSEVIDRLRELNVVVGSSALGRAAQKALAASQRAPQPSVTDIRGHADRVGEMRRLLKWAVGYDKDTIAVAGLPMISRELGKIEEMFEN